ncbi:MAG: hypothetical protein N3E40_01625 [Dehalococcoidia bacterium]|nr:hypothetical protein [Dehalococcoidia bacterium]
MDKKPERRERVPLGIPRLKMQFPERPGYVRRIINDKPGRLEDAVAAGWQFVTYETPGYEDLSTATTAGLDSRVSRVVGVNDDGSPMRGYLMEIPEEIYNRDQELKEQFLRQKETGMRSGVDSYGAPGQDGRYVPSVGISIRHEGLVDDQRRK